MLLVHRRCLKNDVVIDRKKLQVNDSCGVQVFPYLLRLEWECDIISCVKTLPIPHLSSINSGAASRLCNVL